MKPSALFQLPPGRLKVVKWGRQDIIPGNVGDTLSLCGVPCYRAIVVEDMGLVWHPIELDRDQVIATLRQNIRLT